MTKNISLIILIVVLASMLPLVAAVDPCIDPLTAPDWCGMNDPTPRPQPTQIAPLPTPGLTQEPYPAPGDPYPAPQGLSKPWRLFGLTASEWLGLSPFERNLYRQAK